MADLKPHLEPDVRGISRILQQHYRVSDEEARYAITAYFLDRGREKYEGHGDAADIIWRNDAYWQSRQ